MRHLILICLIVLSSACSEPTVPLPPLWSSAPVQPDVFTIERFTLGGSRCEESRATWTPDHGRLLANADGLISLDRGQTQHGVDPVDDLLSLAGGGVLLATPEGFKVFDNEISDSPLELHLAGEGIQRFQRGSDALWLAGTSGVFRWTDEQLERISDFPSQDVDSALPHQVLIHRLSGNPLLVDRTEASLRTAEIPLPGGSQSITPGPEGRLHARHRDGWWLTLSPFAQEEAWHRVALGDAGADQAEDDLWALARDPAGDGLWAITAQQILYLTATEAKAMPTPGSLLPSLHANVDAYGSLWLHCAEPGKILRIGGPADAEITWNGRVSAFNTANCLRCHDGEGGARDLSGYEQWQNHIDLILDAIVSQRMPQDGRALEGGSSALIIGWKEGGMLE